MSSKQRDKIIELHSQCLKLAQKWESSTPGTKTRKILEERWERAEDRFLSALQKLVTN